MKRRDVITTALAAPHLLVTGCASTAVGAPRAQITVLYDAFGRDPALQKDWGYAAFVEMAGKRILFDTGNNAAVLAKNAAVKGIDLAAIDFVVMSHRHGEWRRSLAGCC
jgi:7,8-dihydropterin-6-yl-methyl-4-(beta-D-ribofuranosyl)aminobenzene 5'-phosphate synthase